MATVVDAVTAVCVSSTPDATTDGEACRASGVARGGTDVLVGRLGAMLGTTVVSGIISTEGVSDGDGDGVSTAATVVGAGVAVVPPALLPGVAQPTTSPRTKNA